MGLILSALWGRAWALLRSVPAWVWPVMALIAWGAWNRHAATAAADKLRQREASIAAATIKQQAADAAETQRRLAAQQEATNEAQNRARAAGVDAAGARAAADRLRAQLAADRKRRAGNPPTAIGGEADSLADLLGQCASRYQQVAGVADAAIIAGHACERSYDALTK